MTTPLPLQPFYIHESSYVDNGVEIGAGSQIWHFCHVMDGSRIGRQCRIGQNVVIGPRAVIGNNVKVRNNVCVHEGVTLEDDVFCGPSMVFTNVLTPRSAFPRTTTETIEKTLVRKGASIGANATILCGITIGEFAMIGAGAVVTKDVAPYAVVQGNPARQAGWACECGVILKFARATATCTECARHYQMESKDKIARIDWARSARAA